MLIRELFFPERIHNIQIIPQNIIGFSIDEKNIYTINILYKNKQKIITNASHLEIPDGEILEFASRATETLKTLPNITENYDKVYVTIPASLVIFKEITLPLKDIDKIRLVIENEVESMLPFAIDDAIIDFIITSKDTEKSQILVAAIQKKIFKILLIYIQMQE